MEIGKDVPDQNLVYVPKCRMSTTRRLLADGYDIAGEVYFQDEFGTKTIMVGLTKKIKE